jgi:predicted Holliday junction resolvase-like endonuclease
MLIIVSVLAGIFFVLFVLFYYLYYKNKSHFRQELDEARKDAIKRSRASLEGRIYEQLVPILSKWPFTPSDARFIASPLDYVVFDGLSTDDVSKIIFVEVKKGSGKISKRQESVKRAIEEGKVSYILFEIE